MKVFLIPLFALIAFVIYSFLKGFGSNKYESTNPASIELEFPIWLVLILALLLFAFINFIVNIYFSSDIEDHGEISIVNNQLVIDRFQYKMTFKRSKTQKYRISISRFWGLFFPKFYRVGRVSFKYNDDSFCFLFPIRDMDLERTIKNQNL